MVHSPKITFGLIVLNGEPFIRYNLRALYPYAHQITVVEGACHAARNIATPDGHSRDQTLQVVRRFQTEEDPQGKVLLVTAEDDGHPDGFWEEKTEMSQAYAKRATGNYLWQVDSDEFYLPHDIELILAKLGDDPETKMISFPVLTFWGSIHYVVDSFYLRNDLAEIHRIFAWDPSYAYVTHRPPTVHDSGGHDLRSIKHLTARATGRLGLRMYHYSLLLPKQVTEKCEYYSKASWNKQGEEANRWAQTCYFTLQHPFRVHSVYSSVSWLDRFTGPHPPQVLAMMRDVEAGEHEGVTLRDNTDVERLLSSRSYRLARRILRASAQPVKAVRQTRAGLRSVTTKTPVWPVLKWCRGIVRGER